MIAETKNKTVRRLGREVPPHLSLVFFGYSDRYQTAYTLIYLGLLAKYPPRPIRSDRELEQAQQTIDSLLDKPELS